MASLVSGLLNKVTSAAGIPTSAEKITGAAMEAATQKGEKIVDSGLKGAKEKATEWVSTKPGIEIPKDQAAAKEAMEHPKAPEKPSLLAQGKNFLGKLLSDEKKEPSKGSPTVNDIDGAHVHLMGEKDPYGIVHGPAGIDLPADGKVKDAKLQKALKGIYADAVKQGATKVECDNPDLVAAMNGIAKTSKMKAEWTYVAPAAAPKPEEPKAAAPEVSKPASAPVSSGAPGEGFTF